ncbi:MAG: hypothetical protein DRJ32_06205 [Thermoprotei archaeon]|nr:MAG: hypothetical protein DRJ32_06205 [Thermoprotei archaeon]
MRQLKEKILRLLEEDKEFRYAVAGYIGMREILERLDDLMEEQIRLREEFNEMRKEQIKLWRSFEEMRKEQIKLREDFNEMRKSFEELRKEQIKLREDFNEMRKEQIRLREEFNEMRKEQIRLREDFNRMIESLSNRLSRVERTLEKLTLDIEDEGLSVVKYRLRELGLDVNLYRLVLPGIEINIYGVSDDVCIIGEVSVRAGRSLVDELIRKIEKLKLNYPEKVRKTIIPVIYVSLAMHDLIERAREEGIWVLKATGDIVRPAILDKISGK